jgi:hypothetical protein
MGWRPTGSPKHQAPNGTPLRYGCGKACPAMVWVNITRALSRATSKAPISLRETDSKG